MKLYSENNSTEKKSTAKNPTAFPQKNLTAPSCLIELEPRIMFDGAGLISMAEDSSSDQNAHDTPQPDPAKGQQDESNDVLDMVKDYTPPLAVSTKEVIFIDPGIDDPGSLLGDQTSPDHVSIILTDQKDPIAQITENLSRFSNLDAVHIVSHGSAATLDFAAGSLDMGNIESYKEQIQSWSNSLSDKADIMIYGCDIASDADGISLITQISELTEADVAASVDTSGTTEQGGDWDLEHKSGNIETATPLNFSDYDHVLDINLQDSNQSIGTGQSEGVSLGDLDGDGDLDAFVANSSGGANKVYLNDGTGNYTDSGQSLGSAWSQEVVLADLDNDGDLDAFVANSSSEDDSVWLNDGSGNFSEKVQTLSSSSARAISMADLDKDGDLDAFIATYGGNEVWVNDGTGFFSMHGSSYGSGSSQDVSLGDIDNDGDIDAFVANWGNQANEVWINDGSGFFMNGGNYGTSTSMGVALADVDQDGDLDAFVANLDGQPDKVWLNDGSGNFNDSNQNLGNNASYGVTMADMDQDGDLDALVVGGKVWENDGSGNFIDSGISYGGRESVVGDLDQDGDQDFFLATGGSSQVWINKSSERNISVYDSGQSLGSSSSTEIKFGDLDNDGDLDAFVANSGSGQADKIWFNDGSGNFSDSGQTLGNNFSQAVELGDLDNDGDLDAFVAGGGTGASKIWLNDGTGTFLDSNLNLGSNASEGVALGDFDNDGDLDAFVANDGGGQANKVWLNNGSGVLTDSGQNLGNSGSRNVAVADLDKDGDLDAFVVNGGTEGNKIWINNGFGVFSDSGQSLGSTYSQSVVLADLDNDGDIDAFVGNYNNDPDKIWLNDGSGNFSDSFQNIGNSSTMNVSLVDIDADGDLDAFAANNGSDQLWLNDGGGSFIDSTFSFESGWTYDAAFADVDRDGDLDVFLAMGSEQPNKIYLNNQAPTIHAEHTTFYPLHTAATAINPYIKLNDFDNDQLQGATITINNGYTEGEDLLSFSGTANISGSWDAPSATLTLTGTATIAEYEAALRSVTYDNIAAHPNLEPRDVSFSINDGHLDSEASSTLIKVMPINEPALFFEADDGIHGFELARTDGTEEGTGIIADINPQGSSNPDNFIYFKGEAFFTANDGTNGTELWKTDGTTAGTILVKNINPNGSSYPGCFIEYNGELFFCADDGSNGTELWKTDGTSDGTVLVKDINPGGHSFPSNFVFFDGELYFTADDGASGVELWKSDGTTAGTVAVSDINPLSGSSWPTALTVFNGALYFQATDGTDYELWKSDGTAAGTFKLKDINPGDSSFPSNFVTFNNELYFAADGANDGVSEYDLWKTDGTADGTVIVKDFASPGSMLTWDNHTIYNGELYFSASDNSNGYELWKTDGTDAGTVMVQDINSLAGSSYPSNLTVFNDELYFTADNGINGTELWKTDGSASGTAMVTDINIGGNAYPNQLTRFHGELYFAADDGINGTELWKTDGTDSGTHIVKELQQGPGSTSPYELTFIDINDPPVLDNSTPTSLIPIGEDETTSSGTLVSDLIENKIIDFDFDFINGMAVTGVDNSNGNWQYSMDGGTNWNDFGAVSDSAATLLAGYSNVIGHVSDTNDLLPGDLLIKGTDIGAVSLTDGLTNGVNMTGAANLVNAINSQTGTTGVEASLTTLYSGSSVSNEPLDSTDTLIDFSLNGSNISFTLLDGTPPDDVLFITAERINAFSKETGIHAEPSFGDNGGTTNSLVLFNILPGNNTPIDISGIDANESAIIGLTDGTYNADAAHNTGEFSLRSNAGDYTISTGATDDSILKLIGLVCPQEVEEHPDHAPPGDGTLDIFSPDNRIRFVPNADFNGTADITFKAWDLSNGCNGETGFDTTLANSTSPFSIDTATSTITITPVGDTPQVGSTSTPEDTQSAPIALNRNPLDGAEVTHFRITSITNGSLYQNDGVTQINNGDYITVAEGNAGLRFTPEANSTATGSFDVESSEDGLSVAAQSGIATATITVTGQNDAPILDNTVTFFLSPMHEDTTSTGEIVADIITAAGGDRITDGDAGALEGIAVVAADNSNGSWEYSTDAGVTWNAFGAVTPTNATLLDDTAVIRFTPNPNYNGTPSLTFNAWDQTSGTNGETGVNASATGGTTPFSSATANFAVQVTPVNDAPVLTSSSALSYQENDPPTAIDPGLTLTDSDNLNMEGATITISANYVNGEDILAFNDTANITGSWDPATATLTLSGTDSIANYENALRSITYANQSNDPTETNRSITFTITDGADSASASATINVTGNNDSPVITGGTAGNYLENSAPIVIDPGLTLNDADSSTLQGATVYIGPGFIDNEDELIFNDTSNISGTWDQTSATLTLSGNDTVANYETALRSITYRNISDTPTPSARSINFSVNDGVSASNTVVSNITITPVNDSPILHPTDIPLGEINPADTSYSGTKVFDLINGNVTDLDSPEHGIAVTLADNANGTWQYSTDNGTNWLNFPALSETSATLLTAKPENLIRFKPDAGFEGKATITFRAWDQPSISNSTTNIDVSANGADSPFSSTSSTASVTVLAPPPPPTEPAPGDTTQTNSEPEPSPIETESGTEPISNEIINNSLLEPETSMLEQENIFGEIKENIEPGPEQMKEQPNQEEPQEERNEKETKDPEAIEAEKELEKEKGEEKEESEDELEEVEEELEEELEEEPEEEETEEEKVTKEAQPPSQGPDKSKKTGNKDRPTETGLSSQLASEAQQSADERNEIIKVMDEVFNLLQCK